MFPFGCRARESSVNLSQNRTYWTFGFGSVLASGLMGIFRRVGTWVLLCSQTTTVQTGYSLALG